MLPKIVSGWQSDVSEFVLAYGLVESRVLTISGEKLGIDDLRDWLNFCDNLTRSDSRYIILLANADLLSPESQSILLKPLEEKKPEVEMYLLVGNENKILPTILSRCELLTTKNVAKVSKYWGDLVRVWKGGPATIIDYCEKFAVDNLNDFLREILVRLRMEIRKGVTEKRVRIINTFVATAQEVAIGNVNKRMALENLLFKSWRMIKG